MVVGVEPVFDFGFVVYYFVSDFVVRERCYRCGSSGGFYGGARDVG